MKRFRKLLLPLFAVLLVLALVFTAACSSCKSKGDNDPETPPEEQQPSDGDAVTYSLKGITLDTSAVKTEYLITLGSDHKLTFEKFDKSGLKVTATIEGSDGSSETRDVSSAAYVDSRAFDATKPGEYDIPVSYWYGVDTATATFKVTVTFAKDGVDVILTDKVIDNEAFKLNAAKDEGDIDLSAELQNVTIDPDKIEVRLPNANGEVDYTSDPLAATDYDVYVYQAGNVGDDGKMSPLESFTGLKRGSYEILAVLESEDGEYQVSNFAVVYVNDELTTLTVDNENTTAHTQPMGPNTMSENWEFTATYKSADSVTFTAADLDYYGDSIDFKPVNTFTKLRTQQTATVTYHYRTVRGEAKTKTADVTYTITDPEQDLTFKTVLDMNDLSSIADGAKIGGDEYGVIEIFNVGSSLGSEETTFSDGFKAKKYFNGNNNAYAIKIVSPGAMQVKVWFYCSSGSTGDIKNTKLALSKGEGVDNSYNKDERSYTSPERYRRSNYTNKDVESDLAPVKFSVAEGGTYYLHRGDTNSFRICKIEVTTVIKVDGDVDIKTATFHEYDTNTVTQKLINYDYNNINKAETYTPERPGYKFDGWYTQEEDGEEFDFTKPITEDTDIYAHWTELAVTGIKAEKTTEKYILVNDKVEISTDDITVKSSADAPLSSSWSKTFELYDNADCTGNKITDFNATEAKTYYIKVIATKGEDAPLTAVIPVTVTNPAATDISLKNGANSVSGNTINGRLDSLSKFDIQEAIKDIQFFVGSEELAKTDASGKWTITPVISQGTGTLDSDGKTATAVGNYTVTYTLSKQGMTDSLTVVLTVAVGEYSASIDAVNIDMNNLFPSNTTLDASNATLYSGDHATVSVDVKTYKAKNGAADALVTYVTDNNEQSVEGETNKKMKTRLKLAGSATEGFASDKAAKTIINVIKIHVDRACTVTGYIRSSSGSEDRTVNLYTYSDSVVNYTNISTTNVPAGSTIHKVTFTISGAGDYYLGSASSGIGVYGIDIVFN